MYRKPLAPPIAIFPLIIILFVLSLTLVACGHRANQDTLNNGNTSTSQSNQTDQTGQSNQSTNNTNNPASAPTTGSNGAGNGSLNNADQQVQNSLRTLDGAQQDVNSSSTAAAQDNNTAP